MLNLESAVVSRFWTQCLHASRAGLMRILLLLPLVFLLTGCGLSKPAQVPPQSTYMLSSTKAPVNVKHTKTASTLFISSIIANPGYATSSMVYIKEPFKLRAYANNRWVAPPAQMLLPILAQRIRDTGYFKAVVTPPFVGVTNYRLDVRLIKLEQDFTRPVSRVRLVMQASLISNTTHRVIKSQRVQAVVKAPENNAYGCVLAANQAAAKLVSRIALFALTFSR